MFLIVLALLFAIPAFADDLDQYVQLLKTDLKAQSRDIISKGMQTFTDEEAKRFWPIYESYMAERGNFRPQFATALSPRRLVRFYQIQHELEVLMELKAVSQIPKMKWWQGE